MMLRAGECQLHLDVDCSDYSYTTPPSPAILRLVDSAMERLDTRSIVIPFWEWEIETQRGASVEL